MSMSKSTNTYNRQNWEDSDFPVLCQTCLGDNPYIRMTKEKYGKECKICKRPFTVFRWCPGARARFKKTEVCQTCAKIKNVCQTCLLDLEYGLPIQVRDTALSIADDLPKSDVNKEYYIQNVERHLASTTDGSTAAGALGKAKAQTEMLLRLARTTPYYKRNRPHICSFWVKGECKRGEECPYRHERPTDPDDPLADQNIKDRYYGTNDPVADKLLKRASTMPALDPPEDRSITTLYVGNLGDRIGEQELHDHFYQYGEIRSINVVAKHQCAFIQFVTRSAAELAAEKAYNKLILQNRRLNIKWGRSQGRPENDDEDAGDDGTMEEMEPVPGIPSLPPPPEELQNNYFNLASSIPLPPEQQTPVSGGGDKVRPLQPPPLPPPGALSMRPPHIGMPSFPPRPPPHASGMPRSIPRIRPPPFLPPHVRQLMRPPGVLHPPAFLHQPPPIPGVGPPPTHNQGTIHYPSQDPTQMGATVETRE